MAGEGCNLLTVILKYMQNIINCITLNIFFTMWGFILVINCGWYEMEIKIYCILSLMAITFYLSQV